MDPLSTGLAGIALVQKSVEFIKSNIDTANSISDIAGAIDGLFAGEKQVQQKGSVAKAFLGRLKMLRTVLSTQNWRRNNSAICRFLSITGSDTAPGDKSLPKKTSASGKKKKGSRKKSASRAKRKKNATK